MRLKLIGYATNCQRLALQAQVFCALVKIFLGEMILNWLFPCVLHNNICIFSCASAWNSSPSPVSLCVRGSCKGQKPNSSRQLNGPFWWGGVYHDLLAHAQTHACGGRIYKREIFLVIQCQSFMWQTIIFWHRCFARVNTFYYIEVKIVSGVEACVRIWSFQRRHKQTNSNDSNKRREINYYCSCLCHRTSNTLFPLDWKILWSKYIGMTFYCDIVLQIERKGAEEFFWCLLQPLCDTAGCCCWLLLLFLLYHSLLSFLCVYLAKDAKMTTV